MRTTDVPRQVRQRSDAGPFVPAESGGMKSAQRLTVAVIALAVAASAIGLFHPTVYRETAWVVPQNRGQDLVTLITLAILVPSLASAHRRSPRATLVWFGLLGYLAYTYTGAAFAYGFNALFLVYVALFSLTGAALIAGLSAVDAAAIKAAFSAATPRRAVCVFLLVLAVVLCMLWLGQIIPFFVDGTLPPMIELARTPTVYVFVLDLGVVVPLALLSAWWLWRDRPWGYVLAGFVLVKAATMGLALISMTFFALRAGLKVDPVLSVAWVVLAGSGLAMAVWFFRNCRASAGEAGRAAPP